jgi:hypothetical protein
MKEIRLTYEKNYLNSIRLLYHRKSFQLTDERFQEFLMYENIILVCYKNKAIMIPNEELSSPLARIVKKEFFGELHFA